MHLIKNIFIFIFFAGLTSACIKSYQPKITPNDSSNYVVSGHVTNEEGYQYISVSKTSSLNSYEDNPVSECIINIFDDNSNAFTCEEYNPGKYRVWMNDIDLTIGTSYLLDIITPQGDRLVSDFEKMYSGGIIDSIYYQRKDILTAIADTINTIKGIQFFVDLHGNNQDSRFYKLELTETWESHSDQPIRVYYDGELHYFEPPDYSKMVCWQTITSGDIYVISTEYLSNNEFKLAPLSFVNNKTQRLKYLYSLYIKQYSLSKNAYTYWEQLHKNSVQRGGLYLSQPINIEGNICNNDNLDQKVLGFFYVSAVSKKRIFVKDVENLEIEDIKCDTTALRFGIRDLTVNDYPAFLTLSLHGLLTLPCADCTQMGGDTIKPDFWP